MKRDFLLLLVLLGSLALHAASVDVESARTLGQRFVQANFSFDRQSDDLTLVYSQPSFYVFNVGDSGFVILSSDDSYRPVIGYSDEGVFNPDDMAPALQDYLGGLNEYRMQRGSLSASRAANEWRLLRETGRLETRYGGKDNTYLVETKWNQNYPYNYCCPADAAGPGGHVYAGCVATAAAQLMKYWDHPLQGTGSHTYTPEDNPQYGPITVNFGETTYDWDNMPNSISSTSPVEELEAVGTLIYHCGVAVDMNYRPTSSGATTTKLCTVMPQYFSYTNYMTNIKREDYTRDAYMQFLIDAIDMDWPMVHRGGGHAYVLDGYNEAGLVHFNWGWGGSSDGWFDIDGHNYTDGESAIYNYVPADIYAATPNTPTNLTATPADDYGLAATVEWNNPSVTLTNATLASIDQIVVMRGSEIVYTEDNVTPGAASSFVDNTIPCFGSYKYTVFAVVGGQRGKSAIVDNVVIGPACQWKFVASSNNFQGWRGAYISVRNMTNVEVDRVTITNSTPTVVNVDMPLGLVKMVWVPSDDTQNNFNITINIKDFDGNSVYSYTGYILSLEASTLYEGNNGCGNTPDCGTPSGLTAVQDDENENNIVLQWTGVEDPGYGYIILRDSIPIIQIIDGSVSYVDENVAVGGHCYEVAVMCEGGMSDYSNMACATSGGCYPARHFNFETTANFKCKLIWDSPSPSDGLSGYYLYRKTDGEDYKRIKLVNANATSYTDNSVYEDGDYYYKLVARYNGLDCTSAPAAYLYNPNQYYVHFYYSTTGVGENENDNVRLYPNPTSGVLRIEAPMMQSVSVYNLVGQLVCEKQVQGDEVTLNLKEYGNGMFMVVIQTTDGFVVRKVSVIE